MPAQTGDSDGAVTVGGAAAPATSPAPKAGTAAATVFDKLGGWPALEAAVDLFYVKVLADPLLAPHFAGVSMEKQRRKQVQFMAFAFGGTGEYMGKKIDVVHRKMIQERGVGLQHFDAVLGHFIATLKELNVAEECIDQAAAVVLATRPMFDPVLVNAKYPKHGAATPTAEA